MTLASTFLIAALAPALIVGQATVQERPTDRAAAGTDALPASFSQLTSSNPDVMIAGAAQLDRQRSDLIQALLGIIDSTNSPAVKVTAVTVLGEYRAAEAVPVLVQHLEWDQAVPGGVTKRTPREVAEIVLAPVSIALQKIGMPAVAPLLARVAETDDKRTATKCVAICGRIEGVDVTEFRLRALLAKETDQTRRARIQSALESLTNRSLDK